MAVVLVCVNGYDAPRKKPCSYTVRYPDSAARGLVTTSKAVGGFDCPQCKGHTLKVKQTKKPGA